MDASNATAIGSDGGESDGDADDEGLLLAMQLSMATMSPKPSESTAVDE